MTNDIKPTKEQWMAAVDLARAIGYPPDSVHDLADVIAPFLARREAAAGTTALKAPAARQDAPGRARTPRAGNGVLR